jgi:hypothetical protein
LPLASRAFQPHLAPGESLKHWAYGVKQPPIWLILILFLLAILPGAIAVALLTKEYVIGLTDRRLIVLLFSGKLKVKEMMEYQLGSLPPVKTSTGGLFTHISIQDPARPFVAKFHRLGMKQNREHAMAIAAAISGQPAAA